jgi:hypothetical protein
VFGVIMLIAVLVYFVGGCVYQRTVMHQRGWRQLPNYSMWASIARFLAVRYAHSFPALLTPCVMIMVTLYLLLQSSRYEKSNHLILTLFTLSAAISSLPSPPLTLAGHVYHPHLLLRASSSRSKGVLARVARPRPRTQWRAEER